MICHAAAVFGVAPVTGSVGMGSGVKAAALPQAKKTCAKRLVRSHASGFFDAKTLETFGNPAAESQLIEALEAHAIASGRLPP